MFGEFATLLALAPTALVPVALDPAPTDVTVAWAAADSDTIEVSWHETGDRRDRVSMIDTATGGPIFEPAIVAAGAPDHFAYAAGQLYAYGQKLRVVVQAVDDADQPVSEPGRSPVFDADRPITPVGGVATPRADGTVLLTWKTGPFHDDTPGDPLDTPADRGTIFRPIAATPRTEFLLPAGPETTEHVAVVTGLKPPGKLGVRTSNHFGDSEIQLFYDATTIKAAIPRTAVTGARITVTGTSTDVYDYCDHVLCTATPRADADRPLQLQARTASGSAWRTVATTRTSRDGKFTFAVTSPGSRDYRVLAPPYADVQHGTAKAAGSSAIVTVHSTSGSGSSGSASGSGPGSSGGGGLPITGAPIAWIAAAGALLLALGVLLGFASRRRTA